MQQRDNINVFLSCMSHFLNEKKGVIITDNVLFRGLVAEENIENKRIRSLVKKIKKPIMNG
ncbi:hypothetical protein GCM10020331_036260 [Ectobacillus funiculus]